MLLRKEWLERLWSRSIPSHQAAAIGFLMSVRFPLLPCCPGDCHAACITTRKGVMKSHQHTNNKHAYKCARRRVCVTIPSAPPLFCPFCDTLFSPHGLLGDPSHQMCGLQVCLWDLACFSCSTCADLACAASKLGICMSQRGFSVLKKFPCIMYFMFKYSSSFYFKLICSFWLLFAPCPVFAMKVDHSFAFSLINFAR